MYLNDVAARVLLRATADGPRLVEVLYEGVQLALGDGRSTDRVGGDDGERAFSANLRRTHCVRLTTSALSAACFRVIADCLVTALLQLVVLHPEVASHEVGELFLRHGLGEWRRPTLDFPADLRLTERARLAA